MNAPSPSLEVLSGCMALDGCPRHDECQRHRYYHEHPRRGFHAYQFCRTEDYRFFIACATPSIPAGRDA